MTAVCESDGQWTPNPGDASCSPRPTLTPTPTRTSTPTGPGEKELPFLYTIQLMSFSAEYLQCMA